MRRTLAVLIALALPLAAHAQSVHDAAAYLGTAFTTGIDAPRVEQPMLGDTTNVWGVHAFYTHIGFGLFQPFNTIGPVKANAFGGAVSTSLLSGRLGLAVMGGYLSPSCSAGETCNGFADIGGDALFRILRAPIETDSAARITVSLRGATGWAFAPDSDKYVSATVGLPIAFSAPEGRGHRIVGFVTPGLAWGTVKTLVPNFADSLVVFHHDGVSGMLSGGVAYLPTASGVGLSLGFQKLFVSNAGTQFSAALTWNMPRLGDR
jgi:hypothetical protein